jgi:hypothetical protein
MAVAASAQGFHLPESNSVAFNWVVTDGNGFTWDVYSNCCVANGTPTPSGMTYDGCMLPLVNEVRFDAAPGGGLVPSPWSRFREYPREIEGGGWTVGPLQIAKRVHVPVDRAYCRFIDMYENRSEKEFAFTLRYRVDVFRPIGRVVTASEKDQVGENDLAFLTADSQDSERPVLCHVLGMKGAPLSPKFVRAPAGQQIIECEWELSIPAHKTVALCLFESQQPSVEAATRFLKQFDASRNLQGVPNSLRRIIGNLRVSSSPTSLPALARGSTQDKVVTTDGEEVAGTVQPGVFALDAAWGKVELAGDKFAGMVRLDGNDGRLAVFLADGQVVVGRAGVSSLSVRIRSAGVLEIPLDRVRSWARRIDERFPSLPEPNAPRVLLRSGDQLSFDPRGLQMTLHSACGSINLTAGNVLAMEAAEANGASCAVTFSDGSRLTGRLEPNPIDFKLGLGATIHVGIAAMAGVYFPEATAQQGAPCILRLPGEDELMGQWTDTAIALSTPGGKTAVDPRGVRSIAPDANGQVRLLLWDESVLVGGLDPKEFSFHLACGPALKVPVERIESLIQPGATAPDEVLQRIEKLVVQLVAKDFKDREAATKALAGGAPAILPLLRKHRNDPDPEVRARLELIFAALEARAGK